MKRKRRLTRTQTTLMHRGLRAVPHDAIGDMHATPLPYIPSLVSLNAGEEGTTAGICRKSGHEAADDKLRIVQWEIHASLLQTCQAYCSW